MSRPAVTRFDGGSQCDDAAIERLLEQPLKRHAEHPDEKPVERLARSDDRASLGGLEPPDMASGDTVRSSDPADLARPCERLESRRDSTRTRLPAEDAADIDGAIEVDRLHILVPFGP